MPPAIDIWAPMSSSGFGFCVRVLIGMGVEAALISVKAKPLGKKPSEAGLIDQIEGQLLPGEEP